MNCLVPSAARVLLAVLLLLGPHCLASAAPPLELVPAPLLSIEPGRETDELWLIDSRQATMSCDFTRLHVWRGYDCGRWRASALEELFAAEPGVLTVFFIHGNRVEPDEINRYGLSTYRGLARQMPAGTPIRFVIWSWPSSQVKGLVNDVRVKAARTDASGYLLANVLSQLHPDTPVGLLGYSFGGRIVTGALHLLGGGHLGRFQLETPPAPRAVPYQVVLMAPAMNNDWLLPGRYHGQALTQSGRMLIMINSVDRALKHYHVVSRYGKPRALGFTGFAGLSRLGAESTLIDQLDAAGLVGRAHDMFRYVGSSRLMSRAAHVLLPESTADTALAGVAAP